MVFATLPVKNGNAALTHISCARNSFSAAWSQAACAAAAAAAAMALLPLLVLVGETSVRSCRCADCELDAAERMSNVTNVKQRPGQRDHV
jgi:hypothetical protein